MSLVRKYFPEIRDIVTRIFAFAIPLIIVLTALKFFAKRQLNPEQGYESPERVVSPVETPLMHRFTRGDPFSRWGHQPIEILENTIYDWQKVFDIFSSNDVNRRLRYSVSSGELETLSSRVRSSKGEVFRGSADEIIEEYGDLIKEEARYYKLDWRLIIAMIKQESAFISDAISPAGAYGFMQIMPRTGSTLEQTLNLQDFRSPRNNLIAGIYYYAVLVGRYDAAGDDKYKFALAAYNAGSGHVEDAMTIAYWLEMDYLKWENVSKTIRLLGPENDSLHLKIWNSKPPNGRFSNWKEPVEYVSNIIYYWGEYKRIYPEPGEKEKKKKLRKKI